MYLLDTNVISEMRKLHTRAVAPEVQRWADSVTILDLYISSITLMELEMHRTPPHNDALIAATALVHGLTVVTRNVADFAATGVKVLNPWD